MEWKQITDLLSNDKMWTALSAVAAAVAAVAAMVTVFQAKVSRTEDLAAKRPYFTLVDPGIKSLPQSPLFRILLTMQNIGVHPASDLDGKILFVNSKFSKPPEPVFDFSVANDIPTQTPTPWYNDSLFLPPDAPVMYVVLTIRYCNPILQRDHSQAFFMRWNGAQGGKTDPNFVHVSSEEKKRLEQHLREILHQFRKRRT